MVLSGHWASRLVGYRTAKRSNSGFLFPSSLCEKGLQFQTRRSPACVRRPSTPSILSAFICFVNREIMLQYTNTVEIIFHTVCEVSTFSSDFDTLVAEILDTLCTHLDARGAVGRGRSWLGGLGGLGGRRVGGEQRGGGDDRREAVREHWSEQVTAAATAATSHVRGWMECGRSSQAYRTCGRGTSTAGI